jgi:hypothetical protein
MLKGGAAALLFQGAAQAVDAEGDELQVGTRAPPVVLTTVDGARISSVELLGSVVILTCKEGPRSSD